MPFEPGQSGNPNGRTKGTGSRQQLFNALVEPHREALFKKAIDLALDGNESMLRLLLDRMLPAKPKDEPIQIDMPDTTNFNNTQMISLLGLQALRAVISGNITPEDAGKLTGLVTAHYRIFEPVEIMNRLNVIEEDMKNQKGNP